MDKFQIAVLGFLIDHEKHGYDLFKEISQPDGFGSIYSIKIGRLYALLNKSEASGYVSSKISADGNRPPKKIFLINPAGKKIFEEWMNTPVKHGREIRTFLLMKIFFAEKLGNFSTRELVQNQIEECEMWMRKTMEKVGQEQEQNNYKNFVQQFRKSQIEGYINWLQWCERRLEHE